MTPEELEAKRKKIQSQSTEEWLKDYDEAEELFGSDGVVSRACPDCPECKCKDTSPDYGAASWPDEFIPDEVKAGGTPFGCLACGHCWVGEWPKQENDKEEAA